MWYAIGYVETYDGNWEFPDRHEGMWHMITGPHTTPRAGALALGKHLVAARGAAPWLHSAFTTICLVQEEDLSLYSLFPVLPTLREETFDVVPE